MKDGITGKDIWINSKLRENEIRRLQKRYVYADFGANTTKCSLAVVNLF